MRGFLTFGLAVLGGLVVGPCLILVGLLLASPISVSGWTSDWTIGSDKANPYLRAYIAVRGLLALQKEEAVYFRRQTDEEGAPLLESCTYELTGAGQPARWWSITLYDSEGYLPINEDGALSIDATRAGSGSWRAIISAQRPESPDIWVSSNAAQSFDLTLRLYEPSKALLADPETELNPPSVKKLSCEGET